jgi:membrane fusion protein (multidrug efflux system)
LKNPNCLLPIGVGLGIGVDLYFYWHYTDAHPASDDSYLQARILAIATQVGGAVAPVNVIEAQKVQLGDILFPTEAAALRASQQAAMPQLDQAKQQEIASIANIIAANAQLLSAAAAQTEAQRDFDHQARVHATSGPS